MDRIGVPGVVVTIREDGMRTDVMDGMVAAAVVVMGTVTMVSATDPCGRSAWGAGWGCSAEPPVTLVATPSRVVRTVEGPAPVTARTPTETRRPDVAGRDAPRRVVEVASGAREREPRRRRSLLETMRPR